MTILLPRSAWTRTPLPDTLTPITTPAGIAVHYTGSTTRYGDTASLAQSASRLEAERRLHTSPPRSWQDVAYTAAADQEGRLFNLRGVAHRSAANGSAATNAAWGAITVLIGVGDTPTPAAVEAVRWWRRHVWLARWPNATKVVGHCDLYATDCPGCPVRRLIAAGAFTADTAPGDDMPTPQEIAAAVWTAGWPTSKGRPDELAQDRLLAAARGAGLADDLSALAAKIDALSARPVVVALSSAQIDELAAAVVTRLPAGVLTAAAVADELAARLHAQ